MCGKWDRFVVHWRSDDWRKEPIRRRLTEVAGWQKRPMGRKCFCDFDWALQTELFRGPGRRERPGAEIFTMAPLAIRNANRALSNVRFALKATEVLRCRELKRCAISRHRGEKLSSA